MYTVTVGVLIAFALISTLSPTPGGAHRRGGGAAMAIDPRNALQHDYRVRTELVSVRRTSSLAWFRLDKASRISVGLIGLER